MVENPSSVQEGLLSKTVNSQLFLLIIGFICTAVVGQYISNNYQEVSSERDRQHEIFIHETTEAKKVIETITLHITSRAYALQKVHWQLESNKSNNVDIEYKKYLILKDNWNVHISIYRHKLKSLVDEEISYKLLAPSNGKNTGNSINIHSEFIKAHALTKKWKKCAKNKCNDFDKYQKNAHMALKSLHETIDSFLDELYGTFLNKYKIINRRAWR